jgi:hypothetical protein
MAGCAPQKTFSSSVSFLRMCPTLRSLTSRGGGRGLRKLAFFKGLKIADAPHPTEEAGGSLSAGWVERE